MKTCAACLDLTETRQLVVRVLRKQGLAPSVLEQDLCATCFQEQFVLKRKGATIFPGAHTVTLERIAES